MGGTSRWGEVAPEIGKELILLEEKDVLKESEKETEISLSGGNWQGPPFSFYR